MRYPAIGFLIIALFASLTYGQAPVEESLDRVFQFTFTERVQDLQEIATVIRSVSEMRHVSSDTSNRSLTLRGTAAQIALAEWLFNELDKPVDRQAAAGPHELRLPGGDDVVRVFYLKNVGTTQEVQEMSTVVRSMTEVRKLFTYSAPKALTLRGTAAQIAFAEWIFSELDQSRRTAAQLGQDSAPHEFRLSGDNDVARVFYLTNTDTPQGIQEIASQVRSMAEIRRGFVYSSQRALALRGTASQLALAERLIKERDK
jgi:hypothetical protein